MIRNASSLARTPRHAVVLEAVAAGIEAVHPRTVIPAAVSIEGERLVVGDEAVDLGAVDELVVVGAGKPAGEAALALERLLGDRIDRGAVVTDAAVRTERIEVHVGTHPLPSPENVAATRRIVELATAADGDDLVLVLLGGGASALLCAPAPGVSLEGYRAVTDGLISAGASIHALNAVRKHLSAVKGGQLARALAPAPAMVLVFSDVVGDPLDVIASGPTSPDPTTFDRALEVVDRYDITVPPDVGAYLRRGRAGAVDETPGADDPSFDGVSHHIVADNGVALEAAADTADARGYPAHILSSRVEGEARAVGRDLAAIALSCLDDRGPYAPPVALLAGGESTVTVQGAGRGGPNQEVVLAAADTVRGAPVVVAAVDTDGIDGRSEAAGAIADGETVTDGDAVSAALAANDAFGYLDERGLTIDTGRTGTNVNDLTVFLVAAP